MAELLQSGQARGRLHGEPLASHHDRAAFSCGVGALDAYIKQGAGQDQGRNLARVFVLTPGGGSPEIRGYYTLSNYAITVDTLPAALRQRMPTRIPLPATLLGRIAIDQRYQGQGLGMSLLLYALREALRATRMSASLGVVVDAMSDQLVSFYEAAGFEPLVDRERHLIIPTTRLAQLFPREARPALTAVALTKQLRLTAEQVSRVAAPMTEEQLVEITEDLQRRLRDLLAR